ncbi:PREDICTED: uncharacterized protein LOC105449525 [Wasmannia auropunctata]|uniref:uncharacterized protein LOC105449525 n=1 Tax=Wasmannia auropunctata TaxID=64793 RepID=UPI0005EFB469|nr:PREDICTED: uncharacterized protein LOC105449525 [Wasmannia auropunctata]
MPHKEVTRNDISVACATNALPNLSRRRQLHRRHGRASLEPTLYSPPADLLPDARRLYGARSSSEAHAPPQRSTVPLQTVNRLYSAHQRSTPHAPPQRSTISLQLSNKLYSVHRSSTTHMPPQRSTVPRHQSTGNTVHTDAVTAYVPPR